MTVALLVVEAIVLKTHSHTVLLHLLNVRHAHLTCKERVFTHILEVSSVVRRPVDVHARAEQHVLLTVACLLADALSVECGGLSVPSRGKAAECRVGCAGVVGPSCLIPFVPFHFRTDSVRTVGTPEFRNTEARHTGRRELALGVEDRHLFLHCHSGERVGNPLIEVAAFVHIDRNTLFYRTRGQCDQHQSGDREKIFL